VGRAGNFFVAEGGDLGPERAHFDENLVFLRLDLAEEERGHDAAERAEESHAAKHERHGQHAAFGGDGELVAVARRW